MERTYIKAPKRARVRAVTLNLATMILREWYDVPASRAGDTDPAALTHHNVTHRDTTYVQHTYILRVPVLQKCAFLRFL